MARSHTVQQEEKATTSPLLTWMIALAALVLMLSALTANAEGAPGTTSSVFPLKSAAP